MSGRARLAPALAVGPAAPSAAEPDLARWALLGLPLLLLWDASGWDFALSAAAGGLNGFPWRDHWLTARVLHDGGRLLSGLLLAMLAWDVARPWVAGPSRRRRAAWLVVVLVSLIAVPALKRLSGTSCPWDLAAFGGTAPWLSHWRLGGSDGGPGHCFPSGHAVAAFGFIGLVPLWAPHRPGLARALGIAVFAAGALFGTAQLLRGAHFLSHTLWSAWLCVALAALAQRGEAWIDRRRAGSAA